MMKKIFKYFSLVFFSAFLLFVFTNNSVSANYDSSKNKVSIVADNATEGDTKYLKLKIKVTYQRGFATNGKVGDIDYASYKICQDDYDSPITTPDKCTEQRDSVLNKWKSYANGADRISDKPSREADLNPTSETFEFTTGLILDSTGRENYYVIFVQSFFCSVREVSENGGSPTKCLYWHDPETDEDKQFTALRFKVGDILHNSITNIENEEVNQMMQTITNIVYNTLLPIIYIALGAFLVVKGAILGFQIVKSADEPQVRQEKISSLKWLVIGVAVAYAATILVNIVTGYFKNEFGLK